MPSEPNKPATRIRSAEIRRAMRRGPVDLAASLRTPGMGTGLVIWVAFALVCSVLAVWAWERPLVAIGRVMNETATVRVDFTVEDKAATDEARKAEKQRTPRVYVAEMAVVQDLRASLENLPRTVSAATSPEQVDAGIREQFQLTSKVLLDAVQAEAVEGKPTEAWTNRVSQLMELLLEHPLLEAQAWQRETQSLNRRIELWVGEDHSRQVPSSNALNVEDAGKLDAEIATLVREAGFSGPAALVTQNRLTTAPRPTYRFDDAETRDRQNQAALRVKPKQIHPTPGQVIFTRGDALTPVAFELYRTEMAKFRTNAEPWQLWARRASIAGAVAAITGALIGYTGLFCPRIRRSAARLAAIAGLLTAALGAACWASVLDPRLLMLTAIAPTVFVGVILVIAYDQRVGLAFAVLHGLLVCTALRQPIGMLALMITGVGTAVWMLKEIRDRTTLIRMAAVTGAALALGTVIVSLIDRPITLDSIDQTLSDALLAGFGGLLVGMITLFILPTIEKAFDITTSMTLIELRDPKQPLLRELQQRAPGTYNHSLNVANLAEAAADAIKVNSLQAYVGSLYHDAGKMNKPEYFVENQSPGINKHDKLSPAMSLLVIVGHVKDGMELAREFALPNSLHHFIEAHHGTTLVEYFYHRARKLAAAGPTVHTNGNGNGKNGGPPSQDAPPGPPNEIEYRYPGPKPRSKEVAIVMICDAVESAARTMPNPTPSRIEAVVRALATKRLMDGQFDECDLTLRELNTVVETVAKTLSSIYHSRIAYPEGASAAAMAEGPRTGEVRLEEADSPTGAGEAVGRAG